MKKLVLLIFLAGGLTGEISTDYKTFNHWNCRYWNWMESDTRRVSFVAGWADGYIFMADDTKQEPKLYPFVSNFGEISDGITEICKVPGNARIPIGWAVHLFKMKADGESDSALASAVTYYRRSSAGDK